MLKMVTITDRLIIIGNRVGFAISVCSLRERGRMSKSVYVRVSGLRIIDICSSLCDRTTALISRWGEKVYCYCYVGPDIHGFKLQAGSVGRSIGLGLGLTQS